MDGRPCSGRAGGEAGVQAGISEEGRGEPCGRVYGRARRVRVQAGARASTPLLALASGRAGVQARAHAPGLFSRRGAAAYRAGRGGVDHGYCGSRRRAWALLRCAVGLSVVGGAPLGLGSSSVVFGVAVDGQAGARVTSRRWRLHTWAPARRGAPPARPINFITSGYVPCTLPIRRPTSYCRSAASV